MRAMVLSEQGSIEGAPLVWQEVPDPVPKAGEVRLRVTRCAVCRTDLHVIEGDLPPQVLPLVPGHQIVGVVDALGPGCSRLRIGQRVGVAWLRATCGQCIQCRGGRENLCPKARFTGYHADGGYAELAVAPEEFAYEIPGVFSDGEAAPLLCAGIIGYRALQRSQAEPGGTLAIYGFGSSAHVVIQIAVHRGCRVFAVSRSHAHQALARELGAEWAGSNADEMPEPAQSAILFAPVGELVPLALSRLAPGGTLALAGITMSDTPPLNYERHLFHERNIRSVTANTREDGRGLLTEAAGIPVRPHITEFPLQEANRALQALKQGRINGSGVLKVAD